MSDLLIHEAYTTALRKLADASGSHYQGLESAARRCQKNGMISSKIAKRMGKLDHAFQIVRHITSVSVAEFLSELETEIGGRINVTQHFDIGDGGCSTSDASDDMEEEVTKSGGLSGLDVLAVKGEYVDLNAMDSVVEDSAFKDQEQPAAFKGHEQLATASNGQEQLATCNVTATNGHEQDAKPLEVRKRKLTAPDGNGIGKQLYVSAGQCTGAALNGHEQVAKLQFSSSSGTIAEMMRQKMAEINSQWIQSVTTCEWSAPVNVSVNWATDIGEDEKGWESLDDGSFVQLRKVQCQHRGQ